VLKKTALMGDYIGSDEVLLGELSLYGKYVEIPEYMFFRRIHESSTSGISGSIAALHDYYHPGHKKQIYMRLWRHTYEKYKSVWRSSISMSEKNKISIIIFRNGVQNRHKLIQEIQDAIMVKLGNR
jgi:hypothetical protein